MTDKDPVVWTTPDRQHLFNKPNKEIPEQHVQKAIELLTIAIQKEVDIYYIREELGKIGL